MFYCKGKIRCCHVSSVLSKAYFSRLNSTAATTPANNNPSSKDEVLHANNVISFIKTSEKVQEELNDFVYGDFKHFATLTTPPPSTLNQCVIPRKFKYTSVKNLNEILSDNQVKKALELVRSSYKQGLFLSFVEFQNLFIQFLPFNWYAYKLLELYQDKYDYTTANDKVLVLIMKIAYSNFDYKLFDKIFKTYQVKHEKLPVDILMSVIQVYLKSENIQIATQLFNQHVMSDDELPPRVLDLFVSNLYNQTKNIQLCLASYRLWLSRNLPTNVSIDSFVYNILLESTNTDDIAWIEKSLKDRKLFDKFIIKFGNLCNDLSRNQENYNKFLTSNELNTFKSIAIRDNELSSFLNNMTYLHLRHRNYKLAIDTFHKLKDRKEFQLTIFSILRHFEKEEKPDIIFEILKSLQIDANYRIHWSQILIYWRSVIKKYPHLGYEIEKKFKKALKRSKYHRFGFLSKMLLIRKQSSNGRTFESRYYPTVKYDSLEFDLKPLSVAPKLTNIESRLFSGIVPNTELLRKSIKITNDKAEFDRLVEIAKQIEMSNKTSINKIKNLKLNIEIFFKECSFGNKLSMKDFINEQLEIIQKSKFISDEDLCEIFKICVKFDLHEESLLVLQMFKDYNIKIVGDQQILKFLSMFIKWCWMNKDFKNLLTILEWLKNQNEFTTDKYFWSNLKDAASKNLSKIENELNNVSNTLTPEQLAEKEREREYIAKILPHVMGYYDTTLENIKFKNDQKSKLIIDRSFNCFLQFVKWVDLDTETMFEGIW